MARMPFSTPEARVIVCSDGYFEVFPLPEPKTREKPAYRGVIGELGNTVSSGGLLTVRPDSPRLAAAVVAWSAAHGATAVRGELGRGRG